MSDDTMASLALYALDNLPDELLPGIKQSPENQLSCSETSNSGEQRSATEELERIVSVAIGPSLPDVTDVDIKEARKAEETSNNIINWEQESEIPAEISTVTPEILPLSYGNTLRSVHVPPRIIVLTGCTGLLGHHLLSHLLSQPATEKVICLAVRQLPRRNLHTDPRVEYHGGDLSQPNLGLASASTLQDIFTQADAVIHNGADTSHLKPYGSVRAANVDSTKMLASLCVPRHIPLHYISSAGVGIFHMDSSTVGFPPEPVRANADSNLGAIADGSFGYGCSKLVCEVFLARMVATHGLRVVIHRPSTIIREGDDAKGDGAERDWVNAFLTYVRKLGAVPEMPIMRARPGRQRQEKRRLDLVSVQTVWEGIARHLLHPYGSRGRNSGGGEGEKSESEEEQQQENRLRTDDWPMDQERAAGVTYVNAVGDDTIPLDALSDLGLPGGGERYNVLPRAEWMAAALAAGLHPGVAVLIDGMIEGEEEYPLLIRGEKTYWESHVDHS
ncbi:hypothetical protein E0Z10_g3337 [Xylaria hypoxylon]|uniref:Thioester reductase (TE) domain-containing protein n=1 Tax=Xylaria hypoxylon TaxID=37992 RepID=A0A4Z0YZQ0_9PEZI|nr:hypothetical protein E0Z10_g3337 [Xylaria hypoxylon]